MSKGHQEHSFYSLPEFEQWRGTTEGAHTWKTKYYKGLGTSTAKEAKEYFSDMERHRIPFKYSGPEDDDAILLVSSKFYVVGVWLVAMGLYVTAYICMCVAHVKEWQPRQTLYTKPLTYTYMYMYTTKI